jgi:hypothetical protein
MGLIASRQKQFAPASGYAIKNTNVNVSRNTIEYQIIRAGGNTLKMYFTVH